ncbi:MULTISPECIES: Hsp33 family molecular chaperone HslO [Eubacteriales]|uniref:Hsp33 family molecular chaperone HslO n=1 Tax=Eubacteriales TaxID=186802 RepID=UPI000B3725F8|nr:MULTISPECIES: Hsp33 family molecular chaperone HslO [Eubacteriales]OUN85709.1 Hsp33 family molecular chaperone [Gemmiger sp. An50]
MGNMIRGISENGGVIFCGVDSTNLVRTMEQIHKTSAVTSAALGRLLTAASIMGIMLKNSKDSITLRVNGGGPAGTVLAVADGMGCVKGYVENPVVEIPLRPDGKLNVGGAVGRDGTLSIVRDLGLKEPYVGQIPLVSGEIAEDITSYYATSEQIPTVCALGVLVAPDLTISCAGGYLLQLLPGATEEEITMLEKNIANVPSVTTLLQQGKTMQDIMEMVMQGFDPQVLDEYDVEYRCDCTEQRVERALISMGRAELEKLAAEEPVVEVNCQFCDKKYNVDVNKLLKSLD